MTRYTFVLLTSAALMLLIAFTVAAAGAKLGYFDPKGDKLVRERAEQLEGKPAEIVFVGDSSLGFGVKAKQASSLTGRSTANLALSGSFGIRGSFEMMRRAQAAFDNMIFVIVHTADILGRPRPALVAARSKPPERRSLLETVRLGLSLMTLRDLRDITTNIMSGARTQAIANTTAGVYDFQSNPASLDELLRDLTVMPMDSVEPDTLEDLRQIAAHCAAQGLTCFYGHGPLWEEGCVRFAAELAERDAVIRDLENSHFRMLPDTPFCMPTSIVGNNSDHVRPEHSTVTTRFYAGLVAEALASPAFAASAP